MAYSSANSLICLPHPHHRHTLTLSSSCTPSHPHRVGDILESVNGVNLSNADHREAVRAVKETKRNLSIVSVHVYMHLSILICIPHPHTLTPSQVLRRRKSAYPIQMGIVNAINSVPSVPPPQVGVANSETLEYSLYITNKESMFTYQGCIQKIQEGGAKVGFTE